MTSGIYKLTFKNGHYYIGKSKDIQRRWKEHFTKFEKGTAARNMQEAFNQAGYPSTEIIYEVHPEHLDVLEPIAIHNYWGPKILNTTRESCCEELLERHIPYCKYSLATILLSLEERVEEIDHLNNKIIAIQAELEVEQENFEELLVDIKSGTELERVEVELGQRNSELAAYKKLFSDKVKEIGALKSRGWFSRVFNL